MYHVNAQGIDERMINVHYYYIRPRYTLIITLKVIVAASQRGNTVQKT